MHKGVLSNALLTQRPDLMLFMVDSWKQFDSDTYRATKDTCAFLTQEQQDQFLIQTRNTNIRAIREQRARILIADSAVAAECVEDGSLDFAFIDAEHSYDGCARDIRAWRPKIRLGGWLCGHDYGNQRFLSSGVARAVDELLGKVELGADYTWFWKVPLTNAKAVP